MIEFIKLELNVSKEGLKINGIEYRVNIQFDTNEIIICDEEKRTMIGSMSCWINFMILKDIPLNIKVKIIQF